DAARTSAPDASAKTVAADQAEAAADAAAARAASAETAAAAAEAAAETATARAAQADAREPEPEVLDLQARQQALRQQQIEYANRLREAQINAAVTRPAAQVVTPAVAEKDPVSPTPLRNLLLGLAVGLLLGVALAFLADHLDHSVRRREEVVELIDPV